MVPYTVPIISVPDGYCQEKGGTLLLVLFIFPLVLVFLLVYYKLSALVVTHLHLKRNVSASIR